MMNTRNVKSKISVIDVVTPASHAPASLQQLVSQLSEMRELFLKKIAESEELIMQKIGVVIFDFVNLKGELRSLRTKVVELDKRHDRLAFDIKQLQATVGLLENDVVASDVVIYNIPNEIEAVVAVNKVAEVIGCGSLQMRSAFRIPKRVSNDNNNSKVANVSVPIIAKLQSPNERSKLLRALASFRKNNNRQVSLKDIGLNGLHTLRIHECLSSSNKNILSNALRYKRDNLLSSVFTLRGYVYIRKLKAGDAIKIFSIDDLNNVVGCT